MRTGEGDHVGFLLVMRYQGKPHLKPFKSNRLNGYSEGLNPSLVLRCGGRVQDLRAGRRQVGEAQWRLFLHRLVFGRRFPRLIGEPPGKRVVAALACGHLFLTLAARRSGLAFDAQVEMIVVAPIGPHFGQPCPVAFDGVAEFFLDAGVDQNALELRL
jgi:hypothetical protein